MNNIVHSNGFIVQRKTKCTHKTNFDDELLTLNDERQNEPFVISPDMVVTIILSINITALLSVINQENENEIFIYHYVNNRYP